MEEKYKILMTADTLGGVWNYCLELCKALENYPIEIHLISFGNLVSKSQFEETKSLRNLKLYSFDFNLEWMKNPDIKLIKEKIYELYSKIKPDLIHFNNYVENEILNKIPKITVFHSCVQTWWKAVKKEKAPQEWNTYFELVENSLKNSDKVVFPSKAMFEEAKNIYSLLENAVVIPNAREVNLPENIKKEKIILCSGRIWDEAKNLKILGTIAKQLPWPVYIAGDHINPNHNKEISLENVVFLGKLNTEEIIKWFCKAEIYVNPGFYEPFGLAVLEAAQANCALLLSEIKSLQEIWEDAALYFNPENKNQLKNQLLSLIENTEKRKSYALKAKKHSSLYKRKIIGKRYFELYKNLINEFENLSEKRNPQKSFVGN